MKEHERITKQLMAIGCQRNDAAAFARTYRKIMDANREDLFPEIIKPVMPVQFKAVNVSTYRLRASVTVSDREMEWHRQHPDDLKRRVVDTLASRLADELAKGSMKIETRKFNGAVEFIGTVNVIHPSEWDKY